MSLPNNRESLGYLINEATADQHAALEELVMSHFKQCLYPATSTPLLYAEGLSYFLIIFRNLELVLQHNNDLYDPRLVRTDRLNADVMCIKQDFHVTERRTRFGEQEWTTVLKDFDKRMGEQLLKMPHLLLAYAWVLYLAIFSGGRYMKASLQLSFRDAWLQRIDESKHHDAEDYLRFWIFGDNSQENEEIRSSFKSRFEAVAETLSTQQQHEVVIEAGAIMQSLAGVVQELGVLLKPPQDPATELPSA